MTITGKMAATWAYPVHCSPCADRYIRRTGEPPENDEKRTEGDKGRNQTDRQIHDIGREEAEIFRDTLVRVIGRAQELQMIVSATSEPGSNVRARQPAPPPDL